MFLIPFELWLPLGTKSYLGLPWVPEVSQCTKASQGCRAPVAWAGGHFWEFRLVATGCYTFKKESELWVGILEMFLQKRIYNDNCRFPGKDTTTLGSNNVRSHMLLLNPDDVTPEKPLQSKGLYLTISAQTAARCQPGCETEKAV